MLYFAYEMNDGCGKFIKYAVFLVNFIIMVGGLAILGIGIWTLTDKPYVEKLLGTQLYVSSAAIVVAMGAIITLISFMGCCGALKEVKCLLMMFFIILLLIFIILLVGTILGFVLKDKLEGYVTEGLQKSLVLYGDGKTENKPITEAWDSMQSEFKCCGVHNKTDWKNNPNYKDKLHVPVSCCTDLNPCPTASAETRGCYDKVFDFIKQHATLIAGIGIALVLVLILGMIFSCALFLMI